VAIVTRCTPEERARWNAAAAGIAPLAEVVRTLLADFADDREALG
jgi:hypothetical protein